MREASIRIDIGHYPEAGRLLAADAIAKKGNDPPPTWLQMRGPDFWLQRAAGQRRIRLLYAFHPAAPAPGVLDLDSLSLAGIAAETALARAGAETARRRTAQVTRELSGSTARDYLKRLEARAAPVEGRTDLQLGHASVASPLLQPAVELRGRAPWSAPYWPRRKLHLAGCYLDQGDRAKAVDSAEVAKQALGAFQEPREAPPVVTLTAKGWQACPPSRTFFVGPCHVFSFFPDFQ